MIRRCSILLALIAATPASALSCLQPSIENTYRFADESPTNYSIAVGSLRAVGASIPPEGAVAAGGDINDMRGYVQPAQFEGQFFTGTDFSLDRSVPVTVEVTCLSAWCGSFSDIESGLFFLEVADDGSYVLEAGPCGGNVFLDPNEHTLFVVQECFSNGC
jgi:hypothetical protein